MTILLSSYVPSFFWGGGRDRIVMCYVANIWVICFWHIVFFSYHVVTWNGRNLWSLWKENQEYQPNGQELDLWYQWPVQFHRWPDWYKCTGVSTCFLTVSVFNREALTTNHIRSWTYTPCFHFRYDDSLHAFVPYDRQWIKQKLFQRLKRLAQQ